MAERLLLAQLARAPVEGRVKTRLQPALSTTEATRLHSAMVEHTCRMLCDCSSGEVQLWIDGDVDDPLFIRCQGLGDLTLHRQQGDDLGQRMSLICQRGLAVHRAVVLVGSDAPTLDKAYIHAACAALQRVDAVVGPALDGGYVLIGLSREIPDLFVDMPWGTDEVLRKTVETLERGGLSFELLQPLPDIDRPDDLRFLPDELRTAALSHGA